MYTTVIKDLNENKVKVNENNLQNVISITFETNDNGKIKIDTITLIGPGTLKSTALV